MKKESNQKAANFYAANEAHLNNSPKKSRISRRKFVKMTTASAIGFTILPRHVLGGKNYVAPSDKITLAYIGTGTEGIREMLPMLAVPEIQIVAVCDPNKEARGYRDWGPTYLSGAIKNALKKPDWSPGGDNLIPGGRDNGKNIVETYYANVRNDTSYKGCAAYADVRELLEKEKDLDSIKIMTPDHLHGVIAIAAMKRGKHVMCHKPISNRLLEGKKVIDMARSNPKIVTHLVPWDSNGSMEPIMNWINGGAIGTLREVHNWTNRPVWPQYPEMPKEKPPVPDGFQWDLWLGPEADRPYSPDYTNMVFRGWYDFGGGSMADMGHYSLWTVFNALQLTSPTVVEPHRSHFVDFNGAIPYRVNNNFSFPMACTVRFSYPANGNRGPVDLFWYDGGMRPQIPDELAKAGKELPEEGMMFVGDSGKILAGFNVQNPQIISGKQAGASVTTQSREGNQDLGPLKLFAESVKAGKQYPGSFPEAEFLTEAINLYAVALRSNKLLQYDAVNKKVTNSAEADKYLSREYRQGWSPDTI